LVDYVIILAGIVEDWNNGNYGKVEYWKDGKGEEWKY
jgi:hypothetical protein